MSNNFFTIFENYFKCCSCRGCCFSNEKIHGNESNISDITSGNSSPYSFDDISNPRTPMTSSSSCSSIEESLVYRRPKFKPYVGIIPANYYSD